MGLLFGTAIESQIDGKSGDITLFSNLMSLEFSSFTNARYTIFLVYI